MNKQKLSLAAIQDKLSRNEMKQIMAGSGTCCVRGTWTGGGYQQQCGISMASAQLAQQTWSQYGSFTWCCASC